MTDVVTRTHTHSHARTHTKYQHAHHRKNNPDPTLLADSLSALQRRMSDVPMQNVTHHLVTKSWKSDVKTPCGSLGGGCNPEETG